jgi:hypothetical protein
LLNGLSVLHVLCLKEYAGASHKPVSTANGSQKAPAEATATLLPLSPTIPRIPSFSSQMVLRTTHIGVPTKAPTTVPRTRTGIDAGLEEELVAVEVGLVVLVGLALGRNAGSPFASSAKTGETDTKHIQAAAKKEMRVFIIDNLLVEGRMQSSA